MASETTQHVPEVAATLIHADDIDRTFKSTTVDLISSALGGKVIACSDEYFAEASNLVNPKAAIKIPGKMVFTGAWYDGWETRRHNPEPFDWVIIRLGVASGVVEGVEVDTFGFSGNHAPAISVEGVFSSGDEDVIGWRGGKGKWETILPIQEAGPSARFGWKLSVPTAKAFTHVRLNMYPDGGIARFRLYGQAIPVFPEDNDAVFDLAAVQNGGRAVACSDEHFGVIANLILPGRGKDMGDGWETSRSRGGDHVDWAIIRLGAHGVIDNLVVDTAFFRGNFPQAVKVEAIDWNAEGEPGVAAEGWTTLVEPSKCGPDQEHAFESLVKDQAFTHVKLVMIPDGGVKRLRVFGKRSPWAIKSVASKVDILKNPE